MIGWRGHLGKICPSPPAGPASCASFTCGSEGIDITVASLTVQRVSKKDMDEMMSMVNRAAELLAGEKRRRDLPGRCTTDRDEEPRLRP